MLGLRRVGMWNGNEVNAAPLPLQQRRVSSHSHSIYPHVSIRASQLAPYSHPLIIYPRWWQWKPRPLCSRVTSWTYYSRSSAGAVDLQWRWMTAGRYRLRHDWQRLTTTLIVDTRTSPQSFSDSTMCLIDDYTHKLQSWREMASEGGRPSGRTQTRKLLRQSSMNEHRYFMIISTVLCHARVATRCY